jgi:esterase/lipase superfamily enzyme
MLIAQRLEMAASLCKLWAESWGMNREYHKWHSWRLGREMEMLVFGYAGLPVLVFPTSCGRFFEFEGNGMVEAVRGEVEAGRLQFFCVDSVDAESWYNRSVGPRWRIARHVQYQEYILNEVVPLIRGKNQNPKLASLGCSFGGYHAANIALRHPDIFTGFLALSGAFDLSNFLGGYHDSDCYFNQPIQYLHNMTDPWFFEHYRRNQYVLAAGDWDICLGQTERMASLMRWKEIPVTFDVWGERQEHDWPLWKRMIQRYL